MEEGRENDSFHISIGRLSILSAEEEEIFCKNQLMSTRGSNTNKQQNINIEERAHTVTAL